MKSRGIEFAADFSEAQIATEVRDRLDAVGLDDVESLLPGELSGGMLRRADGGLVGESTVDMVEQFRTDYAVIGASAIDEDGSLLDFDYREVRVAQAIIKNARKTFLVADSSKLARSAPIRIGHMSEIDHFFK